MAGEDADAGADAGTGAEDKAGAGTDKAGAGQLEALKAERTKRQAVEAELATIRAATAKAEAERAEAAAKADEEAALKRGEHERLYTEANAKLTAANAKLADYAARDIARLERLTARNTERVEALPENLRGIVPGLDPEALADWLDKAAPVLLADDTRPAGTRGKPAGAKAEVSYPPEAYAAARQQGKGDADPAEQKRWIGIVWANTAAGKGWLAEHAKARGGS